MRRFMVHLVTEVEFEDGDEASDVAEELPEASQGDCSERGAGAIAPPNQGRPRRKRLGRRNQG